MAGILSILSDVDSVELKLTIPDDGRRTTLEALEIDPLEARLRQVYFLDTPGLLLNAAGVVVRLRRSQGTGDDAVVKLRPVEPSEIATRWREQKGFKVEIDASPAGFVCSGSFRRDLDGDRVRPAIMQGSRRGELFSKKQRKFFEESAPGGMGLDDLDLLGPITVLKLKQAPRALGRKMTVELWVYPDGSRILELSAKGAPEQAFDLAARTRSFLTERGVEIAGEQQAKTTAALNFFTRAHPAR